MTFLFLLFSIFTQFTPVTTPGAVARESALSLAAQKLTVSVSLARLNGIAVGAPVVSDGIIVGKVSRISAHGDRKSGKPGFDIQLSISFADVGPLRKNTVALIASPLASGRVKNETVVELLTAPDDTSPAISDGAEFAGFSSYEDFWSADISRARDPFSAV